MDYFDFFLLLPVFWVLLGFFSIWVWRQHRKHRYLLGLAAAWLCTGLAHTSALWPQTSSAAVQWPVAVAAWLGAVALAQAMAMRFGCSVQRLVLGGITVLMVVGWTQLSALHHSKVLIVGLALILAHGLPSMWRMASRHRTERILQISYSAVCVLLLLSPWLGDSAQGWWLGRTLVLPLCAAVLTAAMVGCVWAESPSPLLGARDRDGVTGLLSRQSFEKACSARPAEQHIRFLVLCDIDHVQRVSHQFGTAAADELLRDFARLLQTSVRTGDLVARLGGDEFAMALRHIDRANAQALVQRIIHAMAQQHGASPLAIGPLTASFGLAMVREGESLEGVLHRAAVLLCQAKDAGCNGVVVEDERLPAGPHCYSA